MQWPGGSTDHGAVERSEKTIQTGSYIDYKTLGSLKQVKKCGAKEAREKRRDRLSKMLKAIIKRLNFRKELITVFGDNIYVGTASCQ